MKRKVFLALALLALMAVGVYAQTEADFTVKKSADGKSITITKYKGTETAVNIPAMIQNLPVTEIGRDAFYISEITSVTIPNSVTSIKIGAFGICAYLTSVTFQGTIPVKNFDDDAFTKIGDIRDKFYTTDKNNGTPGTYTRPDKNSTAWTKGASATSAPSAAGNPRLEFKLNSDGKGYSVSKGTIGNEDVVIPAMYNNLPVTIVPMLAFQGTRIFSVTIPASVIDIGKAAFDGCVMLRSVTFGGANTRFSDTEFPNGMDLMKKYKAGGTGTYTLTGTTWTKQ